MAASNNVGGGEPLVSPPVAQPKERPLEIVTVGRMVHFVTPSLQHRAAIVTAVGTNGIEDTVELTVYWTHQDRPAIGNTELIGRRQHVPFDRDGRVPYSWHWPERAAGFNNMVAPPAQGRGNQ